MNELITLKEATLIEDPAINTKQLQIILGKTPAKFVRKRPAKGGGEWEYVSGGYVKKLLNLAFGWDWDFEILEQMVMHNEAIVKGRLTVRTNGKTIVKTQFGNKDVIYRKQTPQDIELGNERVALSIGNDLKSAATDCLKKCAAELGIAADIYNKEEFREVTVVSEETIESQLEKIKSLYADKVENLTKEQVVLIERVIENKEYKSYNKVLEILK